MNAQPPANPDSTATVDELMITTLASEFSNDTRTLNGAVSFIPVCAILLARRTHAPGLVWAAASIAVDPTPDLIPPSTVSSELWQGATMYTNSSYDFWSYAQSATYNTMSFRGAQMDRFGNINNTVIGDYDHPRVRLPGGGGMADLSCMIPNIFLWTTTHDRRTFVDRLDFRSGMGWGDGGDHRARLGLPGGPRLCVTELCVFDFDPASHAMRVRSLHPGVPLEQVRDQTGFAVEPATPELPVTPLPTEKALEILRTEIDPTSARRREFR